jgi:hypothetical protein
MEIDEDKPILLKDLKAMFNGDDIAAVCSERGYGFWKTILNYVGLTESVGKTYFSKEFVNINSTNFMAGRATEFIASDTGKPRTSTFEHTDYINMGLLTGKKRSEASISLNDEDNPYERIGVQYRDLIRNAPKGMRQEVHEGFIKHHQKILEKARVPWYIPEWLGGLGMTGIGKPSRTDLAIARRILLNWEVERPIQLGRKQASWRVWKLAAERVPKPNYTQNKDDPGIATYNDLVALKCVDLLFDSKISLSQLKDDSANRRTNKAMDHNSKLWNPKSRSTKCPCRGIPKPLAVEELDFLRKYETYSVPTSPITSLEVLD